MHAFRPFLPRSLSLLLSLSVFLPLSVTTANAASAPSRPNLLIIQTDEHNFRTLGCYRALLPADQAFIWGEGIKVDTPHLDWIATHGAIADRFYATSPVCTPSRAALLTGRYPQNTGAIQNDLPLRDDLITYAEVLRRVGYATGYAGKWHLDGDARPGFAPARKFGWEENRYMFNRGHYKKLIEDEKGPRVGAVNAQGVPTYALDGADVVILGGAGLAGLAAKLKPMVDAPLLDGVACAISMAEGLALQKLAKASNGALAKPGAVDSIKLSRGLSKLLQSP